MACDLPEDSLVEILARVPARLVCRSKCIAKAWRDAIEDPFHRKKLPQTLQGFFSITKDTCGLHIGYVSLLARSARRQIDPSLSFLTKLLGFESLIFSDSCNGLLVFEHIEKSLGYVVCNPTTKQWVAVPRYGCSASSWSSSLLYDTGPIYLVFNPSVSSHFHLVQFVVDDDYDDGGYIYVHDYQGRHHEQHDNDDDNDDDYEYNEELFALVNVYSSESGQWIDMECDWDWDKHNLEGWGHLGSRCAVLNGMLHFINCANDKVYIAAVDVQGVTRKIIPVPVTAGTKHWAESRYVAQSQGRLHYINKSADAQLSVWILDDYDTQKWVLKHSVSFMQLFGKLSHWQRRASHKNGYSVVAMHPDGNVVFIVQNWNRKLISYDMDHKLVSVIGNLENGTSTMHVVPYVPCFSESPALTNKL